MLDGDAEVIKEHLEIHQTLIEVLKKYGSVAISDDYQSWNNAGRDIANAKLLMVDQADYNTQHIFFDDNADRGRECCVDVRDVITGESIPNSKFMNMYVVKVQPHKAITESDYFIKQIELCEEARDEEIRKVEAGIEGPVHVMEPKKQEVTETEWDKL
jgi:hypothetical protein